MKGLTVNIILRASIGLMVGLIIVGLGLEVSAAWKKQALTYQISQVAKASSGLFRAFHSLRVERALTAASLQSETKNTAMFELLVRTRAAEASGLAKGIESLALIEFADKQRILPAFVDLAGKLAALDQSTIAVIQVPKADRPKGLLEEFNAVADKMQEQLEKISNLIVNDNKLDDSFIAQLMSAKAAIFQARNSAGNLSVMISAILSGKPVPADLAEKYAGELAKTELNWATAKQVMQGIETPDYYRRAIEKAENDYFSPQTVGRQTAIIRAAINREAPSMTVDEWRTYILGPFDSMIGAAEAALNVAEDHAESQSVLARTRLLFESALLCLTTLAGGAMWLMVSRFITTPLARLTSRMSELAHGDLSIDVPYANRHDEIGALGKTMEIFKQNMQENERLRADQAEQEQRLASERRQGMLQLADEFDRSVGSIVAMVASAATELQASAQTLTQSAEQTSYEATAVAAAAEEASTNVASVASATVELSSSVDEISRQVASSAEIAQRAVSEAKQTNTQIVGLAAAADKIGSIVGLINDIAGKTNLLALNATIEAARAGDAGRGFAVVASEVKQLADQTAKATAEIGSQINAIQAATSSAARVIDGVGQTIETMNQITASVAVSVDGQGAATGEISRNVQEASRGTIMVSESITKVTAAAFQSSSAASEVEQSAGDLSRQAETLRSEVSRFLANVRAPEMISRNNRSQSG